MTANKEKQNLRFKITSQRMNKKVRYDGFTKDEITLIKTKQKLDQFEKELNDFYKHAPRKSNGVVNWDNLSEHELDHFDYIYKSHEKLNNKINQLEDKGFNLDNIMNLFMKLNVNSASY